MDITQEFLTRLKSAGFAVRGLDAFAAFEQVHGTDREGDFAKIVCEMCARPEWKASNYPAFHSLQVWKRVRYLALAKYGNRCQCCGAGPAQGAILHVDHIKPRSKFPELALSLSNLQVLCADCNLGKSNVDETDWRK